MNVKNWIGLVLVTLSLFLVVGLSASPAHADTAGSPIATTANLNMVAVSPDGKWVVTTSFTSGDVFIYNVETDTSTSYNTGSSGLGGVAFTADSSTIYIADYARNQIDLMRVADGTYPGVYGPVDAPWLPALTPDGSALVIQRYEGSMIELGLSPLTGFGAPFAVASGNVQQICMSADGSTVYVPDYSSNSIRVVDVADETVSTINDSHLNGPISCALDSDGSLYIGNAISDEVVKFSANGSYLASSSTIFTSGSPYGIGIVCDALYLGDRMSQAIAVLDPDTLAPKSSPLTVLSDEWATYSGASSQVSHTVWFGGNSYPAGLVSIASSGCDVPPEPLPDTGMHTWWLAANLGGGAVILLIGITVLVVTGRRRNALGQ